MHKHLNTAALTLRLWVVTVLLVVLGVAMLAEFSNHSGYSDDKVRLRVPEMVEVSGDGEQPVSPDHWLLAPAVSLLVPCVLGLAWLYVPHRRRPPRPVARSHYPSRAPPHEA